MGRIHDVWRLLNLPCQGMSELSSRAIDGDLNRMERVALRVHRLTCGPCRRYAHQIEWILQAFRRVATDLDRDDPLDRDEVLVPTLGPPLPDEVRVRIKQRLAEDGAASSHP